MNKTAKFIILAFLYLNNFIFSSSMVIQASYDKENNIIIFNNKIFIESKDLYGKSQKFLLDDHKITFLDEDPTNSKVVANENFKVNSTNLETLTEEESERASGSSFWFYVGLSLCIY